MEMIPKLTVLTADHRGLVFELTGDYYRLGRSPEAELTIEDGTVSGFHCEIYLTDDGCYAVRDEGMSTNGTRINGELATDQVLANADILQIGSVECMYECDDDAASLESGTEHRIDIEAEVMEANTKTQNLAPEKLRNTGGSLGTPIKVVIICLAIVAVGLIAWLIKNLMTPGPPAS